MKIITLLKLAALGLLSCIMFACGETPFINTPQSSTVVSGVASAGIITDGTVNVYKVNPDGSLTLGGTSKIGPNSPDGKYSVNIGPWSGPVVVKAFGSFVDEATKQTITIPEDKALKAALPEGAATGGEIKVPVTPLTDLAVRKALEGGGSLANKINVNNANQAISALFGVDITKTMPVKPDNATLTAAATTTDQKKYTAELAALSQFVKNSVTGTPTATDLENALALIASGITLGATPQVTAQIGVGLQNAANDVANDATVLPLNSGDVNSALATLRALGNNASSKLVSYKLRTVPNGAGSIYGVQVTLGLPAGMTLRADATGNTNAGVVVLSGVSAGSTMLTNYKSATAEVTIAVMNENGFAKGEFATIYGDIPANATVPAAAAFTPVTVNKVSDINGAAVAGITVEVF